MRNDFVNLLKSIKVCIRQAWKLLRKLVAFIINFLRPYENSIKGVVSPTEFYRIIVLAISAGGGFDGFMAYLKGNFQQFITDPNVAVGIKAFAEHCDSKHLAIAIFVLVFTADYLRRKSHGTDTS